MRRVFLFLAICAGACHANTKELQQNLEPESDWVTDTKKDNEGNVREFQAKYTDQKYGISVIYVIPFDIGKLKSLNSEEDKNINCENRYIEFEFDEEKFDKNNIYISTGRIWINNSDYFEIKRRTDGRLRITTKDLYQYLAEGNDLKITFDKTRVREKSYKDTLNNLKLTLNPLIDIKIPFKGADAQVKKAQNECIEYEREEKIKLSEAKASKIKIDAQVQAYREKQIEEVNRRNEEVMKRVNAQMKKPDVKIGMTRQQVVKNTRWGAPLRVNTTVTKYGTSEQWVYWGYKYLYFENGQLTIIQK